MAKSHLCFEKADGTWDIRLWQVGFDNFSVEYGEQGDHNLTYAQAAAKLGQAIMHLQACEGMLDNRTRREAKEAGDSKPFFHV
jgi:hypothetical protein